MAAGARVFVYVVLLALAPSASGETLHPGRVAPPPNMEAHHSVRRFLTELLEKSPTLRRQCAEISAAPQVTVTLKLTARAGGSTRARTTFLKYTSGYMRAEVEIPVGTDIVELLAHELEHITEQIDGVDLPALARTKSGGIYKVDGIFETARAREAGETAAREVSNRR